MKMATSSWMDYAKELVFANRIRRISGRGQTARKNQAAQLKGMTPEARAAFRRERIKSDFTAYWRLPKTKAEHKLVVKRKKAYERQKNAPPVARLSREEDVAAAMMDWPQCDLCQGRMKPSKRRTVTVCKPCQAERRPCVVCQKPHRTTGLNWTTTECGALAALCFYCVNEHGLAASYSAARAKQDYKELWTLPTMDTAAGRLRTHHFREDE